MGIVKNTKNRQDILIYCFAGWNIFDLSRFFLYLFRHLWVIHSISLSKEFQEGFLNSENLATRSLCQRFVLCAPIHNSSTEKKTLKQGFNIFTFVCFFIQILRPQKPCKWTDISKVSSMRFDIWLNRMFKSWKVIWKVKYIIQNVYK